MKITFLLLAALVCTSFAAYDFTKPQDGNELKATLKDEKDTTFIVFFRTEYKTDTPEGKAAQELSKGIVEQVKAKCTAQGLKDTDYSLVDVEIELTTGQTTEKDPKKSFGKLIAELGFEDAPAAPAAATPAAGGATAGTQPAAAVTLQPTDPLCAATVAVLNANCPACKT